MGCDSTWRVVLYQAIQRKSRLCLSCNPVWPISCQKWIRHTWFQCRICTKFVRGMRKHGSGVILFVLISVLQKYWIWYYVYTERCPVKLISVWTKLYFGLKWSLSNSAVSALWYINYSLKLPDFINIYNLNLIHMLLSWIFNERQTISVMWSAFEQYMDIRELSVA